VGQNCSKFGGVYFKAGLLGWVSLKGGEKETRLVVAKEKARATKFATFSNGGVELFTLTCKGAVAST